MCALSSIPHLTEEAAKAEPELVEVEPELPQYKPPKKKISQKENFISLEDDSEEELAEEEEEEEENYGVFGPPSKRF